MVDTDREVANSAGAPARVAESLAARFAAKEAVIKAPRTGIDGVRGASIERLPADDGAPAVGLHDEAAALADAMGLRHWALSLTHGGNIAAAVVTTVATGGL